MDRKNTAVILAILLMFIPTSMLVIIYLVKFGGFEGFFDSGIFMAIILSITAIFPLILYSPLVDISEKILPKGRKGDYQTIIARYRIISFLFALVGIGGILLGLFMIKTLGLPIDVEPISKIFLFTIGAIIFGHLLSYIVDISGYKIRKVGKTTN